jgi:hypothetical protein
MQMFGNLNVGWHGRGGTRLSTNDFFYTLLTAPSKVPTSASKNLPKTFSFFSSFWSQNLKVKQVLKVGTRTSNSPFERANLQSVTNVSVARSRVARFFVV